MATPKPVREITPDVDRVMLRAFTIPSNLALISDQSFDIVDVADNLQHFPVADTPIRQTIKQFEGMSVAGANLHDYMIDGSDKLSIPEGYDIVLFPATVFISRSQLDREMILAVVRDDTGVKSKQLPVEKSPPGNACVFLLK